MLQNVKQPKKVPPAVLCRCLLGGASYPDIAGLRHAPTLRLAQPAHLGSASS